MKIYKHALKLNLAKYIWSNILLVTFLNETNNSLRKKAFHLCTQNKSRMYFLIYVYFYDGRSEEQILKDFVNRTDKKENKTKRKTRFIRTLKCICHLIICWPLTKTNISGKIIINSVEWHWFTFINSLNYHTIW